MILSLCSRWVKNSSIYSDLNGYIDNHSGELTLKALKYYSKPGKGGEFLYINTRLIKLFQVLWLPTELNLDLFSLRFQTLPGKDWGIPEKFPLLTINAKIRNPPRRQSSFSQEDFCLRFALWIHHISLIWGVKPLVRPYHVGAGEIESPVIAELKNIYVNR